MQCCPGLDAGQPGPISREQNSQNLFNTLLYAATVHVGGCCGVSWKFCCVHCWLPVLDISCVRCWWHDGGMVVMVVMVVIRLWFVLV